MIAFFLKITLIYAVAGAAFVTFVRDNPLALIADIVVSLPGSFEVFLRFGWWLFVPLAVLAVVLPLREIAIRLPRAIVLTFVCGLFFLTFTMVKTSLTYAVPFHFGPELARVDRFLHFGHDPWRLAHLLSPYINAELAAGLYAGLWLAPSMYFPVLLGLFDDDEARMRRYVTLYAFTWIGLGNIVAMLGMSAGPIYFDRVNGGTSFAPLTEALAASGVTASSAGAAQDFLWQVYTSGTQALGSGISAFPSVHVGMVALLALYLSERVRWLLWPSVSLVTVYQFLSVYLGWHFAVDGYASILVIALFHYLLFRRDSMRLPDRAA